MSQADERQNRAASASFEAYIASDPEKMSRNIARALEELGKAAAAWVEPREHGVTKDNPSEPVSDMVKTLSKVGQYWMEDPHRALEAQTSLLTSYFDLWSQSIQKLSNEDFKDPFADRKDRRFSDPDWQEQPLFEMLRNAYWVTSDWAERMVAQSQGLDEHTKHKAEFYVRQIMQALSPTNFALTNPEVYKETAASNGQNLVKGMSMLAQDIAAGQGDLKVRMVDKTPFKMGENIATTPGVVVAQNELCQIIQYEPTTKKVLKKPLLICPPWINKFYILDLNPKKSFIRWAVEQGHTVFVISWVNPDERHAEYDWASYIDKGIDFGLDVVEQATGEQKVNAIGYCVGGSLLAAALAYHAQTGDERIQSATFFTTQVDFTYAGDLKVFADSENIQTIEEDMRRTGYLDGSKMANAFNMLRAADLIWAYVVNNYLKGKDPLPFDLLYWNSDSTRMAAANHSFYLRNCYLENNLSRGLMELHGKRVNLGDIKIPVMHIATKEDHIAPPKSVYLGCDFFGGPTEFVLAGSGHIAGIINPPVQEKYQYWTGPRNTQQYQDWCAQAQETKGSWWSHWHSWIEQHDLEDNSRADARQPGGDKLKPIENAPGSYVQETAK